MSYEEAEELWQQFQGAQAPDESEHRRKARDFEKTLKRLESLQFTALLVVVAMVVLAPKLLMQVLPGLAAALIGLSLITRRENGGKWAWLALALLLASYVLPLVLRVEG